MHCTVSSSRNCNYRLHVVYVHEILREEISKVGLLIIKNFDMLKLVFFFLSCLKVDCPGISIDSHKDFMGKER